MLNFKSGSSPIAFNGAKFVFKAQGLAWIRAYKFILPVFLRIEGEEKFMPHENISMLDGTEKLSCSAPKCTPNNCLADQLFLIMDSQSTILPS